MNISGNLLMEKENENMHWYVMPHSAVFVRLE